MKQTALSIEKISFSYEKTLILNDLSLQLNRGEVATIIGTSGSGKTTLFRITAGLNTPQHGTISIYGDNRDARGIRVSYMMQEDLLLPWRRVLDNVLLGVELGHPRGAHKHYCAEARHLLKEMHLSSTEAMLPSELSGGMRQRVALARALLQRRPLLLLDEPFGALDVCMREQMIALLRATLAKHPMTVLLITHDFRDALMLSDRIFLLADGKITQQWQIDPATRSDPHLRGDLEEELRQAMMSTTH